MPDCQGTNKNGRKIFSPVIAVISAKHIVFWGICVIGPSGCATFTTLDETELPLPERVFIYSGTRLDWAALNQDDVALRQFDVPPPSYPLLDIPLSFALDSLFLPLTVGAEIFH
ncbi:MAG: YceK/YidQ family lipoprotein [Methylobacter sp.]